MKQTNNDTTITLESFPTGIGEATHVILNHNKSREIVKIVDVEWPIEKDGKVISGSITVEKL